VRFRPKRLLPALALLAALGNGGAAAQGRVEPTRTGLQGPQVRVTTTIPGKTARLVDIACPTAEVCYAVGAGGSASGGGALLRTTDGGTNWTLRRLDTVTDVQRIECPSAAVCYALGTVDTLAGGPSSAILSTADGGTTWHTYSLSRDRALDGVFLLDLACPGITTCHAVGAVFAADGAFPTGVVLSTDDGGTTWRARKLSGYALAGIVCRTAATCDTVGGHAGTSGGESVFLTTDDGARTWRPQTTGALDGLYHLACPSPQVCLDVGYSRAPGRSGRGVIMVSTTGGATWQRRYSTGASDLALEDIACPAVQVCVVVGEGGKVVVTRNAGATWTDATAIPSQEQTAISCPSAQVCYVVGWDEGRSRSSILRTAG
jgi:photosystem II stability/assembly factor-like uncharacterized protein